MTHVKLKMHEHANGALFVIHFSKSMIPLSLPSSDHSSRPIVNQNTDSNVSVCLSITTELDLDCELQSSIMHIHQRHHPCLPLGTKCPFNVVVSHKMHIIIVNAIGYLVIFT